MSGISSIARYRNAAAALILVAGAISGAGDARAADASLEQQLRRMNDEKQIHDLIIEYGLLLDRGDFEAYSRLFARDGEWSGLTTNFVPVKGPGAIRATMEKAFAERSYDPAHVTNLHLMTNIVVNVDGDRGTGYARYTVITRNEQDEPFVRVAGHYDDVYVREDGRWKFLSRTASRDIP